MVQIPSIQLERLPEKVSGYFEALRFGVRDAIREFKGLTIRACKQMLVMLEDIVFYTLLRKFGCRKKGVEVDVFALLKEIDIDKLSAPSDYVPYSTDYGVKRLQDQGVGGSGGQLRILRGLGETIGLWRVQKRLSIQRNTKAMAEESGGELRAGEFGEGMNLGKKFITKLHDVDLKKLLYAASALIQALKTTTYDSETGEWSDDSWEHNAPKSKCSLLAALWERFGLPGSIYCPIEDVPTRNSDKKGKEQRAAVWEARQKEVQLLEATQYEMEAECKANHSSPAGWGMVRATRESARRAKADLKKCLEGARAIVSGVDRGSKSLDDFEDWLNREFPIGPMEGA